MTPAKKRKKSLVGYIRKDLSWDYCCLRKDFLFDLKGLDKKLKNKFVKCRITIEEV